MTGRPRLTVMAALATLLGAVVLRPLFDSIDFLLPITGAVVVVALTAEAVRRLALPALLAPLAALLTLSGYLVAVFAHRHAILGVFPGAEAQAALRELVLSGRTDIAQLAPPVPTHQGVLLLTTAGVGLVAVLVDLIAVGMRRAAAAGLPLFALFVVPAAIAPDGIGALFFVVAASGYLALLVADGRERLGRWGKPLGAGRHQERGPALRVEVAETSPLARVGRRIAAASLGIAVIVPSLIPGIDDGPLGGRANGTGDGGSHSVTAINPITSLKRQLTSAENTPLLRYTRDNEAGYLRLTTLDNFDGEQWSQSVLSVGEDHRVDRGMPDPLGLAGSTPGHYVQVQIKVEDRFREPWLPLPYAATEIYVDGDWRYDDDTRTIFSSRTSTRGLSYRAKAHIAEPSPDQLRAAGLPRIGSRYVQMPIGDRRVPDSVASLAREVVGDAATDYDKAVALQRFFQDRDNFKYDLTVQDGNGNEALERFLLRDRRGYCEQFASAMAALARILGIPARVNIGFTPGTRSGDGFVVTVRDAHAWPELWFNDVGWVPFEPTPRGDGQVRQPAYSVPSVQTSGQPSARPSATAQPTATASSRPRNQLEPDAPTSSATQGKDSTSPALWVLAGLLATLLVGALPATARRLSRRRRWAAAETPAAAAHAAWAELRDTARDLGKSWDRAATPRALARRLGSDLDDAALAAAARLGSAEERARYARPGDPGPVDTTLRSDVALVASALRSRASRRARLRAAVLPRSVLAATLHAVTGLVADALDGVDAVFAALGRLGRRAVHPLRG